MSEPLSPRIYSTRSDEAHLEEAIERFVLGLAERIDTLQDAQIGGDLEGLVKCTDDLVKEADSLGYPQLSEVGQRLIQACEEAPGKILDRLVDLTDIGRRVRLGHRGAF
jgi:HPt (histidine-containing phosphotransfer) domain-containing protein